MIPMENNFNWDNIKLDENEGIYDALSARGLLKKPSFPWNLGIHLIRDGDLGLLMQNGKPQFLASGGRYTFWSIFNKFLGRVPITQKVIKLGSVQIITIDQGEYGLSVKNGVNTILKPGRYILRAPHHFVGASAANLPHIKLGTHNIISVPAGEVAIVFDNGKQDIITAEQTKDGPYTTESPTFRFEKFRSVKLEEAKLDTLKVITRESIDLNIVGLIRYRIVDPRKAFFSVQDIDSAVKLQAISTLTSVFAQLTVEEISSSLSATSKFKKPEPGEEPLPKDLFHLVTDLFMEDFKKTVSEWGVGDVNLNILSMAFVDATFLEALRTRAQKKVDAGTNLENLRQTTEYLLAEAEREKKRVIINAESQAKAATMAADAATYVATQKAEAAKALEKQPLAAKLAEIEANAKLAEAMSKSGNTIFVQHGLSLGNYGVAGANGQMFFAQAQGSAPGEPGLRPRSRSFSTVKNWK